MYHAMCAVRCSTQLRDGREVRARHQLAPQQRFVARFAIADLLVAAEPMDEVRAVLDRAGLAIFRKLRPRGGAITGFVVDEGESVICREFKLKHSQG